MTKHFDILISGASYSGAALALALVKSLDGTLTVGVIDKAPGGHRPADSPRAFAISAASRHLLEYISVWSAIEPEAQQVSEIEITDSALDAGIRPILLTYENTLDDNEPASHIVPDAVLANALKSQLERSDLQLFTDAEAREFNTQPTRASVTCTSGQSFDADLVVAAEGRASRIREQAGIKCFSSDYHQSGICTTVAHSKAHGGKAVQHFLPAGPFAILPLPGNRSCITWSEKADEARRIMALDASEFLEEVELRFAGWLGEIDVVAKPASWPLTVRLARSFIAPRLALVGDTARGVHPIAGQGLNLGLRDVAALAEIIVENARIGFPPSDPDGLARYQRWRRFDSVFSTAAFDGLNRLFSNDNALLRSFREAGLGIIDRIPAAKSLLVKEAAGLTGDVPRLLRGEML